MKKLLLKLTTLFSILFLISCGNDDNSDNVTYNSYIKYKFKGQEVYCDMVGVSHFTETYMPYAGYSGVEYYTIRGLLDWDLIYPYPNNPDYEYLDFKIELTFEPNDIGANNSFFNFIHTDEHEEYIGWPLYAVYPTEPETYINGNIVENNADVIKGNFSGMVRPAYIGGASFPIEDGEFVIYLHDDADNRYELYD